MFGVCRLGFRTYHAPVAFVFAFVVLAEYDFNVWEWAFFFLRVRSI